MGLEALVAAFLLLERREFCSSGYLPVHYELVVYPDNGVKAGSRVQHSKLTVSTLPTHEASNP